MMQRVEIGQRSLPLPLHALNDFSVSTGGAISWSTANPDVIRISTGYQTASSEQGRIDIILDDPAIKRVFAQVYRGRSLARETPARAVPLRDRLVAVKSGLGLSTKDLAEVLGCARATVYLWLDPTYQGQVNDDAMERLAALEKLTRIWNAYGVGALGSRLHGMALEREGGRSLFSLLKEAPIDVSRCEVALRAIADQCHSQVNASRRLDGLVARGFGS
ncbi:hypothetical protein [Cupriavidus sp. H18C2]|uniref:hypothetical protein n=1 Tax=Cupriavidus sp. H18C2 TaxID=3241602 RepID=UPI003BF88D50